MPYLCWLLCSSPLDYDLNAHLNHNPKDYYTKANKGMALTELHRYNDALKVFEELCNEIPKKHLHRIYNSIADTYLKMDSLKQANYYLKILITEKGLYVCTFYKS